jgi:pyrrolidone-carboxylate peptidase
MSAADRALLAIERRAFNAETWHWPDLEGVEPVDVEVTAWSPDEAERAFMERYATPASERRVSRGRAL